MSAISKLFAPLFTGSGVKGHGNQAGNLNGNQLQFTVSFGCNNTQTVVQKSDCSSAILAGAAGAAVVGALGVGAAIVAKQQNTVPQRDDERFAAAGQAASRNIANRVMGIAPTSLPE